VKVRRSVLKDAVTVATRTGGGSYGDTLADAVVVPCLIDETRRMVRDASGQQVVSEATLTLHPRSRATPQAGGASTTVNPMDVFSQGSEVQINGRESEVLAAKELKMRGQVFAVEVTCA
jgi:hypothetical protein